VCLSIHLSINLSLSTFEEKNEMRAMPGVFPDY
jgi:hypothetical protein